MSYHCPRCGFYFCQNQGGSLDSALADWPRQCHGLPPVSQPAFSAEDDPDAYPF
jgi:hypothetical protein